MSKCVERAEHFKKEMETSESRLKYFESKRAEKIKEIGTAQNSDLFEKNITANERLIKSLEVEILKLKHELGNLFYRNIPYLM
jgi:NAD-dependent DNA ligase